MKINVEQLIASPTWSYKNVEKMLVSLQKCKPVAKRVYSYLDYFVKGKSNSDSKRFGFLLISMEKKYYFDRH